MVLNQTYFWRNFYFDHFYPHIAYFLRLFTQFIGFSIGDLLYGYLLFSLLQKMYQLFRSKFKRFWELFFQLIETSNWLLILFYLLWGLNYNRPSIGEKLGLNENVENRDIEKELDKQIKHLNKLHLKLAVSKDSAVDFPEDRSVFVKDISESYIQVSDKLGFLPYRRPSVKSSLFSLPLSYFGFSGYLNPFTGEAQYNNRSPDSAIPLIISHEIAHQIGIAAENDANLLGIYNGLKSPNLYAQYSSMLSLFQYSYAEYRRNNPDRANKKLEDLHAGILLEFKIRSELWETYSNPFEPYIKKFYSVYLKTNNQKAGIASYGNFIKNWTVLNRREKLY